MAASENGHRAGGRAEPNAMPSGAVALDPSAGAEPAGTVESVPAASPPATMEQLRQRHGWPDDFDLPLTIELKCPSVPETIEAVSPVAAAPAAAAAVSTGP